jgi:saccharopine dehydrogenase (NAD+, L-glutamate forming)
LFGATGYTGALTAEYLARNAPIGCRWALAGRNPAKLEALRSRLAEIDPRLAALALLPADATDSDSMRRVAESARVVIAAVGPYLQYGEPLVAACAAAGTDYVDLTGEARFVDEMFLRYHREAVANGARMVHACGFDSVPHDLGAYFTVQQLPVDVPIAMTGVVRAGGMFSGGTFHSAVNQLAHRGESRKVAAARRREEPRPTDRRVRGDAGKPHRDPDLGLWLVPLPTLDPRIVIRSARALPAYGPDFRYSHYAGVRRLLTVAGAGAGLAALVSAAHVPPLRRLVLSRVPQGEGPSEAKRERSWFVVTFIAEAGGHTVKTQVAGGDPYSESATMLAESALCLRYDDNPPTSGQVTTAQAMGEHLLDRLVKAGISFTVTDQG